MSRNSSQTPKSVEERAHLNSFYEASITLISKPNKDNTRNLQFTVFMNLHAEILNIILSNNPTAY